MTQLFSRISNSACFISAYNYFLSSNVSSCHRCKISMKLPMLEVLISAYHSNTHWFCKVSDIAHTSLSLLPLYPGLPSTLHPALCPRRLYQPGCLAVWLQLGLANSEPLWDGEGARTMSSGCSFPQLPLQEDHVELAMLLH